ncbi:MAG: porin family protein [Longimicrobiales bacterium]
MNRAIRWSVAIALLALPAGAVAQSATGFRAGVRNAGLQTGQGVSTITEAVYGAYLGFGLSDRLAFQAEVVYGVRGADGLGLGTDVLDPNAGDVRLDMQYLEVPLLLRAGFPGERLLASFFAGPYAGFLLSCEVTAGGSTGACDDDAATQRFGPRSTDFGLVAGTGVDIAIGESTIFFDARYTLGILSIQSGADGFDARHNGLAITGGIAVPLGR